MENKNKIIICTLIGINIILIILVILLATDTIGFKNNINNNNENVIIKEESNDKTENNKEDNNENTTQQEKNKIIINNNSIDSTTLKKLLAIIGISINTENIDHCLNLAVSDNDYKNNKKEIFSRSAKWYKYGTYHYGEEKCNASIECQRAYSCGACSSILKKDAHEILRQYNFDKSEIDFLSDMPVYDDEYHYSSSVCCGSFCNYYIKHNITTETTNSYNIRIIDKQNVSKFDEYNYENIINTKNQTVTYTFKKDNEGNYYLDNVNVK